MIKIVNEKRGEAIQDAIEELSGKGGGIVYLPSGSYLIRSAIKLRGNIILKGAGRATILKRSLYFKTNLTKDLKKGSETAWVRNQEGFEAGMEIILQDAGHGNYSSCNKPWAIIKEIKGNKFLLDRPLPCDFFVKKKAVIMNAFPVIFGDKIKGAIIENLSVNGTRPAGAAPEGAGECEGIQLTDCQDCKVINCAADSCGGFGISYSGGKNIAFLMCDSSRNAWHGYHAGLGRKGATHCLIQNCHARYNDHTGIYICWNVTESIFNGNWLTGNKDHGLLIGPFDNHNLITNNVISHNGKSGIIVCRRAHPNRSNVFINNLISNNGRPGRTPAIEIENPKRGRYEQLFFTGNLIVETRRVKTAKASAIYVGEQTDAIAISNNFIQGKWKSSVANLSTGRHNCINENFTPVTRR